MAACVEFKTVRADFSAHPELVPTGVDGQPIRFARAVQGVCLSRREFTDRVEQDLLAGNPMVSGLDLPPIPVPT